MNSLLSHFLSVGVLTSITLHASAGGSFYLWLAWQGGSEVREYDLATTAARRANSAGRQQSDDDWFLVAKKKTIAVQRTKPRNETICRGHCDSSAEGDFVPADAAHRRPRWLSNFITAEDYPLAARQQGTKGRVVLSVIINADGSVRSASLLEASHPLLGEVALNKIQVAVFAPAYDPDGNAVACKVRVPIRFHLN